MSKPHSQVVSIHVDATNPGQFFACCGLIELAERLWGKGLLGWFAEQRFFVERQDRKTCPQNISELLQSLARLRLEQLDSSDDTASPIGIADCGALRLDWWQDTRAGGYELKGWAGRQNGIRIAKAMQGAMHFAAIEAEHVFAFAAVVYDPDEPDKKVEPFYFDSRRGARPFARDIGFSPDALSMTTLAFPVVEFLCLVGLQRCRPLRTEAPRIFDYFTWDIPMAIGALAAAVCGLVPHVGARGFRFENAYRTDQHKHKAFKPAVSLSRRT